MSSFTGKYDTLLTNCIIATCSSTVNTKFGILPGTNNCIALFQGVIVHVGAMLSTNHELFGYLQTVHDLQGATITPGLIDCHTHVVYGGNRCGEWELKLAGASYEEVAQAGGGIVNTVKGTRSATVQDLIDSAAPRIQAMLAEGTTCIEIKSGYGLDLATERNMLVAATQIGEIYPQLTVIRTFLGAHAVPNEYKGKADEYITLVIETLDVLAKEGLVDCVDAFCETVGFSVAQTERVFTKATELGIPIR
jgi:imidazolonepropionase